MVAAQILKRPTLHRKSEQQHQYYLNGQSIYLTGRQHQCLLAYRQYKNIKKSALQLGISKRMTEAQLKHVRRKFQIKCLRELMRAIDQECIQCAKWNNDL